MQDVLICCDIPALYPTEVTYQQSILPYVLLLFFQPQQVAFLFDLHRFI